jgi:hypothetical protein
MIGPRQKIYSLNIFLRKIDVNLTLNQQEKSSRKSCRRCLFKNTRSKKKENQKQNKYLKVA